MPLFSKSLKMGHDDSTARNGRRGRMMAQPKSRSSDVRGGGVEAVPRTPQQQQHSNSPRRRCSRSADVMPQPADQVAALQQHNRSQLAVRGVTTSHTSMKTTPPQLSRTCPPTPSPTPPPQAASTSARIQQTKIENFETRGIQCKVHCWYPTTSTSPPSGVVVIYHGLAGHARFPTVRYLAELLSSTNFLVYGLDFPGHGISPGKRGYISSYETLIQDGLAVAKHVHAKHQELPLFLAGSSMGAAVAIAVSLCFTSTTATTINKIQRSKKNEKKNKDLQLLEQQGKINHNNNNGIAGMILLAPMIKVDIPKWQNSLLSLLSKLLSPHYPLIPCYDTSGMIQFRDPERRCEIIHDVYAYSGRLRIGTAQSCMKLYQCIQQRLDDVETPFLCCVALEDYVVDNSGAYELMERQQQQQQQAVFQQQSCASTTPSPPDCTLKCYIALHGLLCEPQPLRGKIEVDIITWIVERATRYHSREQYEHELQQQQQKKQHSEQAPMNKKKKDTNNVSTGNTASVSCTHSAAGKDEGVLKKNDRQVRDDFLTDLENAFNV